MYRRMRRRMRRDLTQTTGTARTTTPIATGRGLRGHIRVSVSLWRSSAGIPAREQSAGPRMAPMDGSGIILFSTEHRYISQPGIPITLHGKNDRHEIWGLGGGKYGQLHRQKIKDNSNAHTEQSRNGGAEDYAGVTSAIKSFFGATELHNGAGGTFTRTQEYAFRQLWPWRERRRLLPGRTRSQVYQHNVRTGTLHHARHVER